MSIFSSQQPIGIFDSGLGGLTISRAIQKILPHEHILYYGDTLNFPFGEQPLERIRYYAMRITHFLVERNCKMVVIACNSASVAAVDLLRSEFKDQVLIVDMVEPLITDLVQTYSNGAAIGLIGTTQTVQSNFYQKKLIEMNSDIHLKALATPLLAPAIENNEDSLEELIDYYLEQPVLRDIQALILGCTHYPLVYEKFLTYTQDKNITLLDPSLKVAQFASHLLRKYSLENTSTQPGSTEYYVSNLSDIFIKQIEYLFKGNQPFKELDCEEVLVTSDI